MRRYCLKSSKNLVITHRKTIFVSIKAVLLFFVLITLGINVCLLMEGSKKKYEEIRDRKYKSVGGLNAGHYRKINQERIPPIEENRLQLLLSCSPKRVVLHINDIVIQNVTGQGMFIWIVNQASGSIMSYRQFYNNNTETQENNFLQFLNWVSHRRLVMIAFSGSFSISKKARLALMREGSSEINGFSAGDSWAFVGFKGVGAVKEGLAKANDHQKIVIRLQLRLLDSKELHCPNWADSPENRRRRDFCRQVEGYANVCSCESPMPINFSPSTQVTYTNKAPLVTVCVQSSNHPHYLFRTLRSILSTPGVNRSSILVTIEGFYDEPRLVAELLGVSWVHVKSWRQRPSDEVSLLQYRTSLTAGFRHFALAHYLIIIDDDIDVSDDFFHFFNQLSPTLEGDSSLFCISAWNPQGFTHSSGDPAAVYRFQSAPKKAWMITRDMFETVSRYWPDSAQASFDWWMHNFMTKTGKECAVPDMSRVYHFGRENDAFLDPLKQQPAFLSSGGLQKLKDVNKLHEKDYSQLMNQTIHHGRHLKFGLNSCRAMPLAHQPVAQGNTTIIFVPMNTRFDMKTWRHVAKCFRLRHPETSCFHKYTCRVHINYTHTIFVGYPFSPYSALL